MNQTLINSLEAAGKLTAVWTSPDGSTVLVLPYGGRLLGLFAPGCDQNFFWTHPALESADSASSFYQSGEWHNSGGDRTWLAPELDFFFPNYPNLDVYRQPREFDPGKYEMVTDASGTVRLTNRFVIRSFPSNRKMELRVTKSLAPARNPLCGHQGADPRPLQYAGYTLHTRLEILACSGEVIPPVGIWNLLQLPHGGELLVATHRRANPTTYFGSIESSDVRASERLIRYKMWRDGEQKLGFHATDVTGRAGYLYSTGNTVSLVIRSCSVNPSGSYVNVPPARRYELPCALQACSIKSRLGSFAEMEYHAPAIGGGTGVAYCEDQSQLWAFRGSASAILEAGRALISPEL